MGGVGLNKYVGALHYFNEYDGTSGSEFNTGSFLQSIDGDFYFGGVRGLTRFNPNRFTPVARPAPEPYISELSIEDVYSSEISLINLPPRDTMLRLSYSQNTLEFHLGSNDYFRPKSNTFYVKLEPVDANWVPLGALTTMKYYRLGAGEYTLQVRFNNNRENRDSNIYTIHFKIDKVFYKKFWFVLLVALCVIAFIWGGVQLYRRQLIREIKLRRSIAHDLHNTLGGSISSISNMIYVIDRLYKSGLPFQSELKQILDQTRNAHSTMSDVIWVLTRTKQINTGLVNRMEDYADKWLKSAHIKVIFEHNLVDQGQIIPFTIQHEILLAYKELLGNILKHTFSEKVTIQFKSYPKGKLTLMVRNEFTARKTDVPIGGQGLNIVNEHIEQIGGIVEIKATDYSFEVQIKLEKT